MKKILIIILIIFGVRYLYLNQVKKEGWTGFFYPNAEDLSRWTESDKLFDSIDSCRGWVDTQLNVYVINNPGTDIRKVNYDYECGLNCKFKSEYGLNVCEKTIQ